MSHKIKFEQAKELVHGFRRCYLEPGLNNLAIGAVIDAEVLRGGTKAEKTRGVFGTRCWFGLESNDIVVAMEAVTVNSWRVYNAPKMDQQARPTAASIIRCPADTISTHNFLTDIPNPIIPATSIFSIKTNTETLIENFNRRYSFNLNAVAFYSDEGDHDVTDFLGQHAISYVRYYFGYSEADSPDKLRLIIFGVGTDHRNLVDTENENESLRAIILQKSWPPK